MLPWSYVNSSLTGKDPRIQEGDVGSNPTCSLVGVSNLATFDWWGISPCQLIMVQYICIKKCDYLKTDRKTRGNCRIARTGLYGNIQLGGTMQIISIGVFGVVCGVLLSSFAIKRTWWNFIQLLLFSGTFIYLIVSCLNT